MRIDIIYDTKWGGYYCEVVEVEADRVLMRSGVFKTKEKAKAAAEKWIKQEFIHA